MPTNEELERYAAYSELAKYGIEFTEDEIKILLDSLFPETRPHG